MGSLKSIIHPDDDCRKDYSLLIRRETGSTSTTSTSSSSSCPSRFYQNQNPSAVVMPLRYAAVHIEHAASHYLSSTQRRHSSQYSNSYSLPSNPFTTLRGPGRDLSPSRGHSQSHIQSQADSCQRRSNTSVDSMESSFGQSLAHAHAHAHAHSRSHSHPHPHASANADAYSAASIRALAPGVGVGVTAGEQHPVKLTPITGRVSRAKKGVPVHTCEICRPAKTFTRAEHLRRHQLSHQPPDLACTVPGCDKVFHRKDLLERHQQRHEQDESLGKEATSQPSRRSFSTTTSPNQGYSTSPPIQPLQVQTPYGGDISGAGIPSSSISSISSLSDISMSSAHWSPPAGRLRREHTQDAPNAFHMDLKGEYVIDSVPGIPSTNPRMIPGFDEPRTAMAMRGLLSSVVNMGLSSDSLSSSMPWPEGLPSSASESAYSTPPSDQHMPSRTPSIEWTGQISAFPASSSPIIASGGFPLSYAYDTTPPQAYTTALYGDAMGFALPGYEDRAAPLYASSHHVLDSAVRSLSPQQLLPSQTPEEQQPMVAAAAADHRSGYSSRTLSRDAVDALGLFMPQDIASASMSLSREIRSALPAYIEVYWDRAHATHPIIHRPTFDDASGVTPEQLDILQSAMAAVATQFLEHKEHRNNGHQLHAYAREKSKIYTSSQDWPLPVMQAVLLCEYYARFRGRCKKAHRPSLRFEALYQMVINATQANPFPLHLSACASTSQRWRYWVDWESRRRLLSACFLLDVHAMSYFEQSRVATLGLNYDAPETLPIPLSVSTALHWDAQSSDEWGSGWDMSCADGIHLHHTPTVGGALLSQISAADIAAIPAFDAALLQAALVLRLPSRRRSPKELLNFDLNPDIDLDLAADVFSGSSTGGIADLALVNLFPGSASAMAYLALHHTPLHTLLAVSGDSWVFNKKILHAQDFAAHKAQLRAWRDSGSAVLAVTFAARALSVLLSICPNASVGNAFSSSSVDTSAGSNVGVIPQQQQQQQQYPRGIPRRKDMSDFWAVYACALVCWAFGHLGTRLSSRPAALRWIAQVATMTPCAVREMSERERADGSGVVGLARRYVERECLGGKNMLLGDALGVLKKLEEGDGYTYF